MTIVWDGSHGAEDRYAYALGDQVHLVDGAAAAARAMQTLTAETLLLIGPDVDLQSACDLTESLRVDRPEVGSVLLRRRLDVTLLAQALRSGVREVVAADDLAALSEACRRSRDLSQRIGGRDAQQAVREARIVTVFSAKGGVGKTTFSTNLGAHLAATGSRTLVVDLDLAFGDVAISLQLRPQRTMSDIVPMTGHIDEQGLASIVTTHAASGLDTICAPAEPAEAERIAGTTVSELLKVARRCYDYVIVDTPPAFTEHVLAAFDVSDQHVLIATLDLPALKNLRLTLDTLDLLGSPRDSRIVVLNRSDAKVGLRPEDVVTALKQEIAIMVPNSLDVPASVNRGVAICVEEPNHPVSVALRQLVDQHLRASTDTLATRASRRSSRSPFLAAARRAARR